MINTVDIEARTATITAFGETRTVKIAVYRPDMFEFRGIAIRIGKTGTKIWNGQATCMLKEDGTWTVRRVDNGHDYRSARLHSAGYINNLIDWFDKIPENRKAGVR